MRFSKLGLGKERVQHIVAQGMAYINSEFQNGLWGDGKERHLMTGDGAPGELVVLPFNRICVSHVVN